VVWFSIGLPAQDRTHKVRALVFVAKRKLLSRLLQEGSVQAGRSLVDLRNESCARLASGQALSHFLTVDLGMLDQIAGRTSQEGHLPLYDFRREQMPFEVGPNKIA
jgi:hypothetical protein